MNPLERLNKEVKRRVDVVGIFPNEDSIVRLIGAVLFKVKDAWQLQHHSPASGSISTFDPRQMLRQGLARPGGVRALTGLAALMYASIAATSLWISSKTKACCSGSSVSARRP